MLAMILAIDNDDDRDFMVNIYMSYNRLVRKTIYSITHENKDIEDLIEDTFLKLIEKISTIRKLDSRKITSYIVYTSRNIAINYVRHRNVEQKHTYLGGETDIGEDIAIVYNWDDQINHQDELEILSNSLMKLPQKQKDLLYFKYILEQENKEIAHTLGVTESSVRQFLTRARRKARELIEKEMSNRVQ